MARANTACRASDPASDTAGTWKPAAPLPDEPTAAQPFMGDGGQGVLVRGRADAVSERHLRRAVGPAHRRTHTHAFEHRGDAHPGQHGRLDRHDDVAQVQAAVGRADGGGRIHRVGERAQARQRVGHVRRPELAQRDVERIPVDERSDDEGLDVDDASVEQRRQGRMWRQAVAQCGERRGHDGHTFRRQPDTDDLDDDRLAGFPIFAAKYRADAAGTDLMQDAEATVSRTGAVELEAVLGQCGELLDAERDRLGPAVC